MSLVKTFFNFVVVLVFIGTPTVTYWRGSWHILDLYAFPKCGIPCTWITTGISFGVIYVVVFCHEYNKAYIENSQVRAVFLLVLIYPLAFIIVTFWRGIWLLLDHYTTISLFSGLVCHFVGFFIVLLTKTTSSIVPAPGYTVMERINDPADFALQLKVCFSKDKSLRMLNCFLTVFVIGTAVVIYWRGTWVSLDVLSMGQASNKLRSSIISAVVGFGIVFICYCSSESLKSRILIVRTPFPLWWGTLEHGFVYILGFGVVNFWRGLWYLEDIFLLPGWWFKLFLLLSLHTDPFVGKWVCSCLKTDSPGVRYISLTPSMDY